MPEPTGPDHTPTDLRGRLELSLSEATPATQAIAAHFLSNMNDLPFETAASVAAKIGVSEATVGRSAATSATAFQGHQGAIQSDLGDKAWLVGDRLKEFSARQKRSTTEIARGLEREIAAILANYETAASAAFAKVVARLATRPNVFVAAFQTERGHGQFLVHQLQYLRPGVQFVDLAGGSFAEVLLAPPDESCLILIDMRRYSRLARRLGLTARESGIPVTLITDPYCPWSRDAADETFVVQTDFNQFWDTTSAISSLVGLIVNGVFAQLGPEVEARMTRVSALYNDFIGHAGDPHRPLK